MRDWKKWLKSAGIRAVKTIAQTAVANIGISATFSEINWAFIVEVSISAGILSMLTSLAGLPEEKENFL